MSECDSNGMVVAETPELAGPWRRWIAKQIDIGLLGFVLASIIGVAVALCCDTAGWEFIMNVKESHFTVMIMPLVFIVDSVIYALCGNTLGRWLLGVRIVDAEGGKISGKSYFIRNFKVYFAGVGAYFCVAPLITMAIQYRQVNQGCPATYDRKTGFQVIRIPVGSWRIAVIAAILTGLIGFSIWNAYDEISLRQQTREIQRRAENGDPKAQYEYAEALLYGDGTRADVGKAWEYWEKSAENNYVPALEVLADTLHDDYDPDDAEEVFYWSKKYADTGAARGKYFLGLCYKYGRGVAKDPVRAQKLLQAAAASGVREAVDLIK